MNNDATIGLGPLCEKFSIFRFPAIIVYIFFAVTNWSESATCLKFLYSINCALLIIYTSNLSNTLRRYVNFCALFILWTIELTLDKLGDSKSSCFMESNEPFALISAWIFRIFLWIVTVSVIIPCIFKIVLGRTTVVITVPLVEETPEDIEYGIAESAYDSLLPLITYTKNTNKEQQPDSAQTETIDDTCPICLEEFIEKEEVRRFVSCGHTFHPDCIKKWINNHINCPYCRKEIVQREQINESNSEYQPPAALMPLGIAQDMIGDVNIN